VPLGWDRRPVFVMVAASDWRRVPRDLVCAGIWLGSALSAASAWRDGSLAWTVVVWAAVWLAYHTAIVLAVCVERLGEAALSQCDHLGADPVPVPAALSHMVDGSLDARSSDDEFNALLDKALESVEKASTTKSPCVTPVVPHLTAARRRTAAWRSVSMAPLRVSTTAWGARRSCSSRAGARPCCSWRTPTWRFVFAASQPALPQAALSSGAPAAP
jgi:hypothetical protein